MKRILALKIFIIGFSLIKATEQQPDILRYKNLELLLNTGWGHPSPLETYYSQNNIEYPFSMLHTANYRGHIATWEIENEKFFIREIRIEKEKYKPAQFHVKSKTDSLSNKDKVFADWFSGVIECELRGQKDRWKAEASYYFHIRNGIVVHTQILTEKDFKRIEKISEKDTTDRELMAKYSMVMLNRNYIAYYFRLHENDTIIFDNKGGYLSGNKGLSPILMYYSNNHINWPFNWENLEKNGAPNCKWIIEDKKLYLVDLNLYSGLGFYSIDKESIDLKLLFTNKVENNKVFGDWVSGVFLIQLGKEIEDEKFPEYKEFKASEYTYLRINNGIVVEMYTVSSDLDFKNIPENTEPGLIKIIEDFK
jgi:hypothetical protein